MNMERYDQVIADSADPVLTLALPKKSGTVPKGTYSYIESYCTDPGCDCRRVDLQVVNEKMKQKALIKFGFDQDGPFAGPYLDRSSVQAPYAQGLVSHFVDALNSDPSYLERLYRHYRQVREKVEKKPYSGRPFPKPGQLVYHLMPPPDLEAEMLQSLQNLRASGRPTPASLPGAPKKQRPVAPPPPREQRDMAWLVRRYVDAGVSGPIETLMTLHNELRDYLLQKEDAGEELARLLPELCRQSPQDDDAINAALRLLFDSLTLLAEELTSGTRDAQQRMDKLQKALAQQIFVENEDLDLSAAVWNMLVQSRVEILPSLRESAGKVIIDAEERTDLDADAGEEIMSGILRSLEAMGVTSPFDAASEMLQLFMLNEPEMQTALLGEMLEAEKPLLREMSALMVFNPEPGVGLALSQLLAAVDGSTITPETLRRLIVSRNWLPAELRKNVDQTVTNARKARVECAPLERPESVTVYASILDGSGAQSFHIVVPDGSAFAHCALMVREEMGVADAFVAPLKGKGEVSGLVSQLKKQVTIIESSAEYLDLRVCHALSDGVRAGIVPDHWLVRVAELLGRDRWQPIPFDAARELLDLWEELQSHAPKLLDSSEYNASLEDSGNWQTPGSLLSSWFEDDEVVDREITAKAAPEGIVETILETRRAKWLERLVVTALLLKSGNRPPIPWHRVFHVAQAVADETTPLVEIPLMLSIARLTVEAHAARKKRGLHAGGKK